MEVTFDLLYLGGASISVVGVVEYVKGFFPRLPPWVWRLTMALASVAVAVSGGGSVSQIATNAFALLALSQIGYPVIIQLPLAMIEKFRKTLV